jgi:sulfur-carrier protein adenylyltransferase/sulfurtransferase
MNSRKKITERYDRQIKLKQLGEAGQQKLLQAKVLVVGAGGLGCPVLQYLAAAGIGTLAIIDDDKVALNNLHRQPLYKETDIGLSKAETAASHLRQLNPDIEIIFFNARLDSSNALTLLEEYDVIIDGSDNFATRYMVNDACVLLNKPLVYGAISQVEGQVAVFNQSPQSANYRDLFPRPPKAGEVLNCEQAGVMGVLPGIIGTMMANETIKLITGMGNTLIDQVLVFNALNNQTHILNIKANRDTRVLIPADKEDFQSLNYEWLCGEAASSLEIDALVFDSYIGDEKAVFIDVRETGELPAVTEFKHQHIPLSKLKTEWPDMTVDTIIVFCQSGKRSLEAATYLSALPVHSKKIVSLKGGIVQWKQEQLNKQKG